MKVVATSDWRENIAFETPLIVADLQPGEPARCSLCGSDSAPRDRTELWALKHRHPNHHSGYVRFYCSEHLATLTPRTPPAEPAKPRAVSRGERQPNTRRPPAVEVHRALCPDCFIEVAATGICGMCGTRVA